MGSTLAFTIEVPVGKGSGEFDARATTLLNRRLLIVDDNATNRLVIGRHASAWGLDVVEADSAATASQVVQSEPRFDVILIDFRMPDVNGVELAETLAAHERTRGTPLVLLSSVVSQGRDSVFAATINKPIRPLALRNLLIELLAPTSAGEGVRAAGTLFDPTLGARHPLRILIADDSVINQRVAATMLHEDGV